MERHDEMVAADVHLRLAERPDAGIEIAVIGDVDDELRRLAADKRARRLDAAARRVVGQQAVQDRRVRGVDAALQRLQPVAFLDDLGDVPALFRHLGPGEFRRRRHLVGRAEIGPDQPAQLDGRIGGEVDVLLELVLRRLVELIDAVAFDVEFPAVIDAAQPAFLVAPEIQRHAAVRAEFIDQTDAALAVAERDEVLAEQFDAHRRAVRLGDLPRQAGRDPIPPHRIAHRRAGPDAGDQFVFLRWQHRRFPPRGAEHMAARRCQDSRIAPRPAVILRGSASLAAIAANSLYLLFSRLTPIRIFC